MPRRREIAKREVPADPIYNSPLVTKFISTIMRGGKRSTAERIMYKALEIVKEKSADDPLKVFKKAIDNAKPSLEVKSRRVGGANYQIPFPIQGHRQQHYAFMWLVQAARAKSGMPYERRLATEIVDAVNETGNAFKKKEDTHKMAEANRAFAHFARG